MGTSSFGRKKTLQDRLRCSQASFFAKCKSKKLTRTLHETMGAGGQDSTTISGQSAPVVHCHFKLIVVFFVYAHHRCCVAAVTAIATVAAIVVVVAAIVIIVTAAVSLSSLPSLSLSPPPFLSSPLSPPPSPLPSPPQLPPPLPPEHSRFRCCCGARPLPARGLPCAAAIAVAVVARACRQRGGSFVIAVIVRARRQGVAPRRERVQNCSGKEHSWS